jgi:hypothetical protein
MIGIFTIFVVNASENESIVSSIDYSENSVVTYTTNSPISTTVITSSSTTKQNILSTTSNITTTIFNTTTEIGVTTDITTNIVTTTTIENIQEEIETTECILLENEELNDEVAFETINTIVYKPTTHYIHYSSCRWADNSCYEITSTEDIEARLCDECNPHIEIINLYEEPQVESNSSGLTYVKTFSRGTFYAYGGAMVGGSGRTLIDCLYGEGNIKGSIASSYLYNLYGYNYNGNRTQVYLEINGYPEMNGYYYLDDCDAGNSEVIDFFYYYNSNCQFQNQGVVSVNCYIG